LFKGLFDDAALFPPGNAPMPDAVKGHGEHTRAWYRDLVGLFVCPNPRLDELDASAQHNRFGSVDIALAVPSGLAELTSALAEADQYGWLHLKALEVPVAVPDLEQAIGSLRPVTEGGIRVFVEIATGDISRAVADELKNAGLGVKIRTGGLTTEAFPETAILAAALEALGASGAEFKCTAGLHRAIRQMDDETGFIHHGFLNVLLATRSALRGTGEVFDLLGSTDPSSIVDTVAGLDTADIEGVRSLFQSIGTCSIDEPLADLVLLGLVAAP
jgi:hypothetical protein